jgi:hypothetical protein
MGRHRTPVLAGTAGAYSEFTTANNLSLPARRSGRPGPVSQPQPLPSSPFPASPSPCGPPPFPETSPQHKPHKPAPEVLTPCVL